MKRLLQILSVLLAVHLGFAQAGISHGTGAGAPAATAPSAAVDVPSADATVAQPDADAAPCHHHASPDQPRPADDQQPHHQHKDGCCSAGYCHCAAVCGLPFASMTLSASIHRDATGFSLLAAPSADGAPDLRPPIY
jgi:hypothetical protein